MISKARTKKRLGNTILGALTENPNHHHSRSNYQGYYKNCGFYPFSKPPTFLRSSGLARPPAPRVSNETQSLHEPQQGIMIKLKIAGNLNFELMEP